MVFQKIKSILAAQFDLAEESIAMDTSVSEDLGADSLDVVELLMSIEDDFNVEIPDEKISDIKTVGDLVSFIESNLS